MDAQRAGVRSLAVVRCFFLRADTARQCWWLPFTGLGVAMGSSTPYPTRCRPKTCIKASAVAVDVRIVSFFMCDVSRLSTSRKKNRFFLLVFFTAAGRGQ
jgi:hypothetical protein